PVHNLEEVVDDPHVVFRKIIQEMTLKSGEKVKQLSFPVKFSNTPTNLRIPPPELGEHTEEVLKSLDYSKNEIERLIKEGVV
ncbi:MAG: CoA transferase, partial [Thermodesulfobacteriota bacterium]|nr:CoA transferase [Thermodesulfobacteriota bacterium]